MTAPTLPARAGVVWCRGSYVKIIRFLVVDTYGETASDFGSFDEADTEARRLCAESQEDFWVDQGYILHGQEHRGEIMARISQDALGRIWTDLEDRNGPVQPIRKEDHE